MTDANFAVVMYIMSDSGDQIGDEVARGFNSEHIIDYTLSELAEDMAYDLYEKVVINLKGWDREN